MYQPVVQLKSGGYLVINPTEALVSIDINSGRSTREHNIEQTAFNTNLEAAQEIARQLRLRDMAGLVVIDFIDMEQSSHVRKVEKAMKDALKNDRARIQVGRISSFGLMEMSRQRLRTGVLEASTKPCPHCEGTGLMRTASSAGLSALRMIEDEAARGRGDKILLRAGREAAVYVLNKKRAELAEIEQRYGVSIEVVIDESFEGARMTVESSGPRPRRRVARAASRRRSTTRPRGRDRGRRRGRRGRDEEEREPRRARRRPREATARAAGAAGAAAAAAAAAAATAKAKARPADGETGRARADEPTSSRTPPKQHGCRGRGRRREAVADGAAKRGRRSRRRRGRGAQSCTVEPDSSPMVERPIDEEPPIAETSAGRGAQARSARRRKKAAAEAEVAVDRARAPPRLRLRRTADRSGAGRSSRRASGVEEGGDQRDEPKPRLRSRRPSPQRTMILPMTRPAASPAAAGGSGRSAKVEAADAGVFIAAFSRENGKRAAMNVAGRPLHRAC